MQELMLLVAAKLYTDEQLAEQLKENASDYLITKSKDSYDAMCATCMIIMAKRTMGNRDPLQCAKEIEEINRLKDRLNSNKINQQ